jgi:hypothetical protein
VHAHTCGRSADRGPLDVCARKVIRAELEDARAAVIARHGRWTAHNLHLGHGIYTIAPGHVGAAELNVARVLQLVAGFAHRPFSDLRILDLGAYECGFSIELAAHGADVTAVEIRPDHVAKGEFAKQALGLKNLTIREADVRTLDPSEIGTFDVVLCLGILYHLTAQDAIRLLHQVAACSTLFAFFETQVSLSRSTQVEVDGATYHGRQFKEAEGTPGSSVGAPQTFWLTRSSLLNALVAAGFRTASEVALPCVPALLPFEDHVTLVVTKEPLIAPRIVESSPDTLSDRLWSFPERWTPIATQGLKGRIRERIARRRGGGLAAVFPSAPTASDAGDGAQ